MNLILVAIGLWFVFFVVGIGCSFALLSWQYGVRYGSFLLMFYIFCVLELFKSSKYKQMGMSLKARAFLRLSRYGMPFKVNENVSVQATPQIYEALRSSFANNSNMAFPPHEILATSTSVEPVQVEQATHYKIVPKRNGSNSKTPWVMYIHGGGFCKGTAKDYLNIIVPWFDTHQLNGLLVDFPLCPEHSLDDAVACILKAYDYLQTQAGKTSNIAFACDSSGATLCLLALAKLPQNKKPAVCTMFSPWIDLTFSTDSIDVRNNMDFGLTWEFVHFLRANNPCRSNDTKIQQQYSPLHMSDQQLRDMPPMFISMGKVERITDEIEQFVTRVNKLKPQHVTLLEEGAMPHFYATFYLLFPEAQLASNAAARFILRHTRE